MLQKLERLKQIIAGAGSAAVAYSGGVDSTVLLKVAFDCLGDRAVGLTAVSPSLPAVELAAAREIAAEIGVRHVCIESREAGDPRYLANTPDRCYFCKSEVYDRLAEYAAQHGYAALFDGTNADDVGDHRPGRKAGRERHVRSPLQEIGLHKEDIREMARQLQLRNWNKPAAACLSSRIAYGTRITRTMLTQVEQAEAALRTAGIEQVRVRRHGPIARIEVAPDDFPALLAQRDMLLEKLKALGFVYITLDLAGFRSGSMNEILTAHNGRQ